MSLLGSAAGALTGNVGLYVAGGILAAGLGLVGVQTWRLHSSEADAAQARSELAQREASWQTERALAAAAAASQAMTYRKQEQTWARQREEVINVALEKTEAAIVASAATRRAADRLRSLSAAAVARSRGAASDPAASEGCRAAAKTADLLAVVQGRLAEAARGVGEYADAERIGHEACVASPHSAKVTP